MKSYEGRNNDGKTGRAEQHIHRHAGTEAGKDAEGREETDATGEGEAYGTDAEGETDDGTSWPYWAAGGARVSYSEILRWLVDTHLNGFKG